MSNTRTTLSCRCLQSTTSASYFIPFFLSCSFLEIYREKKNARKTRIDPLISVFRARDNGSVNFRNFFANFRHDFAGFGYIGADLCNKIRVLYHLLKSTTLPQISKDNSLKNADFQCEASPISCVLSTLNSEIRSLVLKRTLNVRI